MDDSSRPCNALPSIQNTDPSPPRELHSHDLFRGEREVIIRHGAEAYRLSLTRNGKLILRK